MRAWQYQEENGCLPDEHFTPTEEDDPNDPEQAEIRADVIARYSATNRRRAREREAFQESERNSELKELLSANGIEIPEHLA